MDIAEHCVSESKPRKIALRARARKALEVEKMRKAGGEVLYNYGRDGLVTDHST